MTPENPTTAPDPSFADGLKQKLHKANALKDYAISKNFDVSDQAIEWLNAAAESLESQNQRLKPAKVSNDIDKAIRDLTALTYPATIDTISRGGASLKQNPAFRLFFLVLLSFGIFAVGIGIVSFGKLLSANISAEASFQYGSALAASLGLLGCFTYIMFNIVGILSEKAFESEDTLSNCARLVLGAVLGWVFYFAFARSQFEAAVKSPGQSQSVLLLLPFVVGFSTKLVVGLLNQVIRAVEITLALEDKAAQLAQRKAKKAIKGKASAST